MALKLKGSTSGFVGLDAPSVAGNNTLILPTSAGSAHQILANDITAGVTTFTQVTVSRNGDLTVPGTISIGGTLTYEDVTSVDSVGIVTARGLSIFGNTTGLQVASGISTFQAITATTGTFTSNVSIEGNTTLGNATSDTVTVSGYVNSDIVPSGSTRDLGGSGTEWRFAYLASGVVASDDIAVHSGDSDTKIRFPAADTVTVETGGSSRFKIDSSGNVTIGNDGDSGSNPSSGYDELCIEGGNEAIGMCFLSPAANNVEQTIAFGDSNNNQSGKIQYEHANDAMHFDTAGTERLRIDSSGRLLYGLTSSTRETSLILQGNSNSYTTNPGTLEVRVGQVPSAQTTLGQVVFGCTGDKIGGTISAIADNADWSSGSSHPTALRFFTTPASSTTQSERLRITSTGEMGLGTATPPTGSFHIHLTETPELNLFSTQHSQNNNCKLNFGVGQSASVSGNTGARIEMNIPNSGGAMNGELKFYTNSGDNLVEKMRLASSNQPILKVGAVTVSELYNTSGTGNEGAWLVAGGASQFAASNTVVCRMNRKTSNGKIIAFYYNGSEVGTISTNANSLPSDRNFKTNISDLNLGLSLVNKLKPSQFNFKVDEPNTPVMYGLIAQELEESLTSEGVTKNSTQLLQHNPTDNEKESDYDVDYGKLTPVLINAIKELSTEIETLKSKVAALEGS